MTAPARAGAGAPLLIVGGYGIVGAHAARALRARHPDLPLVLAGRRPEAARPLALELDARTVALDVHDEHPLAALDEPPAAVLAAAEDPYDRLLVDALRAGIPFADLGRSSAARVLDAAVHAAAQRASAPVLLFGGWMAGTVSLAAAAAARAVGRPARIDVTALASPEDRISRESSDFTDRISWPYHAMRAGRRGVAHPMTRVRRMPCPDEQERPAALAPTLEQVSLPVTLAVPSVEARVALCDAHKLWGVVALKRSGALRALAHPALRRLRDALLGGSGPGDYAGFTVTASAPGRSASVDALDVRGQGHLSALGAVIAVERMLGLAGPALGPGICFPEQCADPATDLATLRGHGVVVRLRGFSAETPIAAPGARSRASVPAAPTRR